MHWTKYQNDHDSHDFIASSSTNANDNNDILKLWLWPPRPLRRKHFYYPACFPTGTSFFTLKLFYQSDFIRLDYTIEPLLLSNTGRLLWCDGLVVGNLYSKTAAAGQQSMGYFHSSVPRWPVIPASTFPPVCKFHLKVNCIDNTIGEILAV